jgi:hypothetical protein
MKNKNNDFMYKLFALCAIAFFAMVIFRPIWDYSVGTLNSSLDFITAWVCASLSNYFKE